MYRQFTIIMLGIFVCIINTNCSKQQESYTADIEDLKSLPYVSWTKKEVDTSVSGVIEYDKEKAFPGYNLFLNKSNQAYLMDMDGIIVHKWQFPYTSRGIWEYAVLKDNGNLVAECVDCNNFGAVEITWDSELIWENGKRFHHDVEILPDGSYLIPDRIMIQYKFRNVNFDRILNVSETGQVLSEWSTLDSLEELRKYHEPLNLETEPDEDEKKQNNNENYDYYHLNSIKLLPFTWLGFFDRRFQKGNWLVCLRNANLIIILDKDTKKVVWHWGPGELEWPHMPVMLENGEILIFDNGVGREYTRILQINPQSNKITWEYKTDPPNLFFSFLCGSAQRFANGNTLITDAENGHAFEITKEGKTVWDFYHFEREGNHRKTFYRMIKYPSNMIKKLLKKYKTDEIEGQS